MPQRRHADGDIDLATIAPPEWDGGLRCSNRCRERLGNDPDILHLTRDFILVPEDREPVVAEILHDGIELLGTMQRRIPTTS